MSSAIQNWGADMTGTCGRRRTALQQEAVEARRVAVQAQPASVRRTFAFEDVQFHVALARDEADLDS
jgi:hypothetical protein